MELRQRIKKIANVKTVKVLDAFPKLEEECQEVTPVGGLMTALSYIIIIWLIISETSYFLHSKIVYKIAPDTDFDSKLNAYIDITVAMPCPVAADIMDSTNEHVANFGQLHEEDTWFELEPAQKIQFEHIQNVNAYLRSDYHHIHEFLWRSNDEPFRGVPPRKSPPNRPPDACRVYGKLELNKVTGNFHITAGTSLHLPQGHIHITGFVSETSYNFSHRIHHFGFGDSAPGIINPLEGDERITKNNLMNYQYFIEVVPTEVETFLAHRKTYQYAVSDQEREINHLSGSHGIPGIFFKYDMSALKVHVRQERDSYVQFFVKLCATVGGVHVTLGILASLIEFCTCRLSGK